MQKAKKYFCGIDGGATHSTVVVLDNEGHKCAQIDGGPPLNHWLSGMDICCQSISSLVLKAKSQAGIPHDVKFTGLGLCLSGCDEVDSNEQLRQKIMKEIPHADHVIVDSDTLGPLITASQYGGIVLISGTGSNCLLQNPDGTKATCGGWDHMIGDEGSAYWMAFSAVKICIDDQDNLIKCVYDTSYIWKSIQEHFHVENRFQLLDPLYKSFNKAEFASLTIKIAAGADSGDELCKHLFSLSGEALAKHLLAVKDKIDPKLYNGPFGLPIVCVGSVWKSWNLLSPSFLKTLGLTDGQIPKLTQFSLLKLQVSAAFGAAFVSDEKMEVPRHYENNVLPFFSYGVFKCGTPVP